jgi:predicted ATP-grasp superfamily ATP-dependent carboligase
MGSTHALSRPIIGPIPHSLADVSHDAVQPLALVFGGIGLIRSLGEAGIPVIAAGGPGRVEYSSRYVQRSMILSDSDSRAFIDELLRAGKQFASKPVIFTDSDLVLKALSRHREVLEPYYHFLFPDKELIEDLVDKRRFGILAQTHHLPIPWTYVPKDADDLTAIAARLQYPCIIKPENQELWAQKEVAGALFGGEHFKALKIQSSKELLSNCRKLAALGIDHNYIIQEYIDGRDEMLYDLHIYLDRYSAVRAAFVGQKIRTYPIHFGMGCYTRSVDRPDIIKVGVSALQNLGYTGVANMNLKVAPDGRITILEINTRYSLWTYLGARCRINIPLINYMDLIGKPYASPTTYTTNVYWCLGGNDLRALLRYRTSGEWTFWQWLGSLFHRKVYQYFNWYDPLPFVRAVVQFTVHRATVWPQRLLRTRVSDKTLALRKFPPI